MKTILISVTLSVSLVLILGCGTSDDDSNGTGTDAGDDADADPVGNCLDEIAWYSENAEGSALEVAQKDPNDFGLYDMLGNAVEWVEDCYHSSYEGAPDDGSAWNEETCDYRVIRGGCYGSTARGVCVSIRDGVMENFYGACAPGIRCVREVDAESDVETALVPLSWVSIPGGNFEMGCSSGDEDCYENELPQHTVSVGAFEMTATEMTQQEYFDQTGDAPATYYCPECAVTYVMWEEAQAFCEAVGGRLPTEAEWEYAARGGTATRYYCGNN